MCGAGHVQVERRGRGAVPLQRAFRVRRQADPRQRQNLGLQPLADQRLVMSRLPADLGHQLGVEEFGELRAPVVAQGVDQGLALCQQGVLNLAAGRFHDLGQIARQRGVLQRRRRQQPFGLSDAAGSQGLFELLGRLLGRLQPHVEAAPRLGFVALLEELVVPDLQHAALFLGRIGIRRDGLQRLDQGNAGFGQFDPLAVLLGDHRQAAELFEFLPRFDCGCLGAGLLHRPHEFAIGVHPLRACCERRVTPS